MTCRILGKNTPYHKNLIKRLIYFGLKNCITVFLVRAVVRDSVRRMQVLARVSSRFALKALSEEVGALWSQTEQKGSERCGATVSFRQIFKIKLQRQ